ncbi:MAG: hypothetical protein GF411_02885 [Candidatus Lokiarchaeota archaeon]|nr:hypothetical protein [Candidatus Lokiarchaeota archaeon]
MKIAVIGCYGYVGRAYYSFFKRRYQVIGYDIAVPTDLSSGAPYSKDAVNKCDMAVICVPTPMRDDGYCDTSIVDEVLSWLEHDLILIKSTISPDFAKKLDDRCVFSPEYIGEGGYVVEWWNNKPHPTDPAYHNFHIFGGQRSQTQKCVDVFQKIAGARCRYFQTDAMTACLVKYMENSYIGTIVTFCNHWFNICEQFGVDYREARELLLADERMNREFTCVYPDSRGFGGKCLPKDISAIARSSGDTFMQALLDNNNYE